MCMATIDPNGTLPKNLQTLFHDASTMIENLDLLSAMLPDSFTYEKLADVRRWQNDVRENLLALFGEQFGGIDR